MSSNVSLTLIDYCFLLRTIILLWKHQVYWPWIERRDCIYELYHCGTSSRHWSPWSLYNHLIRKGVWAIFSLLLSGSSQTKGSIMLSPFIDYSIRTFSHRIQILTHACLLIYFICCGSQCLLQSQPESALIDHSLLFNN